MFWSELENFFTFPQRQKFTASKTEVGRDWLIQMRKKKIEGGLIILTPINLQTGDT